MMLSTPTRGLSHSGNLAAASKRGPFLQAVIDVLAVVFCVFFICTAAASIPLALFFLFFCSF